MQEPYVCLEREVTQMVGKAEEARREIMRLAAIASTCEEQARSLRWAIEKQKEADQEAQ